MPEDKPRVLFVDDEVRILESFQAGLRKQFRVDIADGAKAGLARIAKEGPYAVVVSDLKMPGMDGVEFLAKVAEQAKDTVRIMLTGHGDLEAAVLAVNRGQIFRFLSKPTSIKDMARVLEAGVRQYDLIRAERELLRGTLRGSVNVLTEVLSLVSPAAFGRGERIRRLTLSTGKAMGYGRMLQLDLTAMLSQIGCVAQPAEIMDRVAKGETLDRDEQQVFATHPRLAARLLVRIPRMGPVAKGILHQLDRLDRNPDQPMESRILRAVQDYDGLRRSGLPRGMALETLRQREGWYDPAVLEALHRALDLDSLQPCELPLKKLHRGMVLDQDLYSPQGVLLMGAGQPVTETALERLHQFKANGKLPEPIKVLVRGDCPP